MDAVQKAGPLTDEESARLRRLVELTPAEWWESFGPLQTEHLESDATRMAAACWALPRLLHQVESLQRDLKVTAALRRSAEDLAEERRLELQRYRSVLEPKTYEGG